MSFLERVARSEEQPGAVGRHSILLASIVTLLVTLPLFRFIPGGGPRFSILLCFVLTAAVYVSSKQPWTFLLAGLMGAGTVIAGGIATTTGSTVAQITADCLGLGLLGFTTLFMVNTLMHTQKVSRDTVVGGVCVYLLIGLCFVIAYLLVSDLIPGSLQEHGVPLERPGMDGDANGFSATILYFSFVTLTTLGYGDIVPTNEIARMLVSMESIVGQLFLAIFIARLIARHRD
jgi:voltage-gated potassium channel